MAHVVEPTEPAAARAAPPGAGRGSDRGQGLAVGAAIFISGGVLLGVEIAASRVVAPYFGNSLFVWGALIGVVLTGLSVGYYVGGAMADRVPPAPLLVGVMGAGALAVLAIPVIDRPVLDWVIAWDPGPRLDPLVAAVALFGVPSVLLAAVTPIAVRLRIRSLASVGRTAGRLFSISTAGSIAGTFATAFFLVPEFGTDQLFGLAAVALFVAAAAVAVGERLPVVALVALALAGVSSVAAAALAPERSSSLAGGLENWSPAYRRANDGPSGPRGGTQGLEVLYAKDTRYHRLTVVEDGETRYLKFDNSLQSAMYVNEPYRTRFAYTDFFQLALAYNPGARNALFIGLGAGTAPKRMLRDFPDLRLQAVELDPVVEDVAKRFFGLPGKERLPVAIEDGRRYLARHEERWDVIAIDAFFADSIPFHMATREFLELARSRLAPGGVIVTNTIGAVEGPDSKLFRALYRTYRAALPTVLVHPVVEPGDGGASEWRNITLVATEGAAPDRAFLQERWRGVRERSPGAADLDEAIADRHDMPVRIDDVPTLTDDYAPTDALLLLQ